jgi:sarcosine oxidase
MLGACAARHLADVGVDVALVGPAEPTPRRVDPDAHAARTVHSSHEDVARVCRTVDPDPIRAWLGHRSVAQFGELATRTGIAVVDPVGHLWVEAAPGLDLVAASGERFDRNCVRRDASTTMAAFPFLGAFPEGAGGDPPETLWEPPPAGSVNPWAYVRAETAAALAGGAHRIEALVGAVSDGQGGAVELTTDIGPVHADRVLLATGAFSGHGTTPASGLDLEYALHTQLLVHLDGDEANRLAGMPSIIGKFADPIDDFYLTPPVPDPLARGDRWILKIGAPQDDHVRVAPADLAAWFRTDGDPDFTANLARILDRLIPDLRGVDRWTTSCVTTYTPSGHPFIDWLSDRVACAVGGNGYAAKCAPALGELAALLFQGGSADRDWPTEVDRDPFRARYTG